MARRDCLCNACSTVFERRVLAVVRKELRRAMRMRGQLSITIDPFVSGGGAHVFASPNTAGNTYTIETPTPAPRKRGRR